MQHEIYKTEGIIIKVKETGEADKVLSVFTKDFGRLEIFAQGVRKEKSKLNYHLGIYDYSRFCFVAGRERWRLTDAEKINSWNFIFNNNRKSKQISETTDVLEKLTQGQEKNERLWEVFLNIFIFLNTDKKQAKEEEEILKNFILLKILYFLGYADSALPCVASAIKTPYFNEEALKNGHKNLKDADSIIKSALKETSLI